MSSMKDLYYEILKTQQDIAVTYSRVVGVENELKKKLSEENKTDNIDQRLNLLTQQFNVMMKFLEQNIKEVAAPSLTAPRPAPVVDDDHKDVDANKSVTDESSHTPSASSDSPTTVTPEGVREDRIIKTPSKTSIDTVEDSTKATPVLDDTTPTEDKAPVTTPDTKHTTTTPPTDTLKSVDEVVGVDADKKHSLIGKAADTLKKTAATGVDKLIS
ncbi:Maph59 [Matsumuraeses phaseoli granulovirus]|uniref:Maph59 n=1 Tax=Matsumuraeses phaseoli granulovirus TaxID=2760664 RepID=A0AAE7MLK0_9BBAC|nr:Maph59 [Matsumuraeses phaseoli granulovirus]QOD40022.1 Maph59 [Matsumuraeses phaseoli granulovirus]